MYKVRTRRHRNPVSPFHPTRLSSTVRHSPRTHFISRPARQSRSRHTLYAVRYAPGGRGHAITNWQCTSQRIGLELIQFFKHNVAYRPSFFMRYTT